MEKFPQNARGIMHTKVRRYNPQEKSTRDAVAEMHSYHYACLCTGYPGPGCSALGASSCMPGMLKTNWKLSLFFFWNERLGLLRGGWSIL